MKRKNILSILLALGISLSAFSQATGYKLNGIVVEPLHNRPIPGAVISITGLKQSVTTTEDGTFSVILPENKGEVSVWSPGYETNIQPIMKRSSMRFVMTRDDKLKQTAVNALSKKAILPHYNSVTQALKNIPGAQVIDMSGMPGEGSFVSFRGLNTITSESSPLYVVNGVPYMPDNEQSGIIGGYTKDVLGLFDAHDIESIVMLKGTDAAKYGSLGSNGVILIETDKAVDLDTKVEYSGQYGIDWNQSKLPVLGVDGYKDYISSVALTKYTDMANVLSVFPYLVDDPDYYYKYLYNNNTDWQNTIYKPAFNTNNVLKIKGGDAIAKYDFSLGYSRRGGQVEGTHSDKYYARLNCDVNFSRKVSLFATLSMSYTKNQLQEQGLISQTNPLLAALKKGPLFSPHKKDANNNLLPDYATIRDDDGNLIVNNSVSNPLAIVNDLNMEDRIYDILLTTGLKYKVTQDFSLDATGGLYYNYADEKGFIPGVSNKTIMPSDDQVADNTVRAAEKETMNFYFKINGDYQKIFNKVHALNASLGAQMTINSTEYDAGQGINTSSDFYKTLYYTSASGGRKVWGYNNKLNWLSFYATGKYTWNHLLGTGITLSADGASSVGDDTNRFTVYPAINATWYASNSPWLRDLTWLNKLNIKADYTITGNSRYASTLSKYYYVNNIYRSISGVARAGIPNTKMKPERNKTLDLGLDMTLLNNRIDLTFDYYNTRNENLIMPQAISSAYGTDCMYDNLAKTKNTGIELGLQVALIQSKNINWYVGGTLAKNKNRVVSLGGQENMVINNSDGSAVVTEVGHPAYSFYGYQTKGILASDAEATAAGLTSYNGTSFKAGDVHFVDQNNDGVIDDKDRVALGNADPVYFGMFFTNIQYKGFKLQAIFNYSKGNKMYNALRRNMESMSDFTNQLSSVTRRWFYQGQQTDMPKAEYGDPMGNNRFSNRYIEDASFIKLKDVILSYTFKFMGSTTVYVSGQNLWTSTKYLGLDPENAYSYDASLRGFDYGKIALPISFRFGFNIQF